MNDESLIRRLRGMFAAELEEQVRAMNADLLALEQSPGESTHLRSVFRAVHTLKGAARAADVPLVERVCHELEAMLARARDGARTLGVREFALLFAAADALADAGRRIGEGRDLSDSMLAALDLSAATGVPPADDVIASTRRAPPSPVAASGDERPSPARPRAESAAGSSAMAQIRLETAKLDAMLAAAGDLRVDASVAAAQLLELEALGPLAATARRRSHAISRAAGEDAGELAPALRELAESVDALAAASDRLAADGTRHARQLARSAAAVTARARALRMRPFADVCEALPRTVRDLSTTLAKAVELQLSGTEVEADRVVLDALREPLLHLLRNAVDHGIEPPAARAARGKSAAGTVSIAAELVGERLVVRVSDDGGGVDTAALRQWLAATGRAVPATDDELAAVLFEGGTSSRSEASKVSGRGVGLDAVRTAVEAIGGHATARWTAGAGTTFTIDAPLSLASARVVLARVGRHTVAVPSAAVVRLVRVAPAAVRRADGQEVIVVGDELLGLAALGAVLGPPYEDAPFAGPAPAMVVGAGERRVALRVGELLTECELTLRPVDRRRAALPLVLGAGILDDGRAAPVLDAAGLIAASFAAADGGATTSAAPSRRVLVVDDSITTRTLERSVLEAAGYEVIVAVDGADAWRLLLERGAELVVSDVEMPRMDGFALCRKIRESERFARLPIVLVTALESDEQRARGLELGADAYLGKSSFDQQTLLDVVRQYLA